MPGTRRRLLDSFALLAFLGGEASGRRVEALLAAAGADAPLLMNEINLGEVFYVTARARSLDAAEDFLRRFDALPIQLVGNTRADVLEAARIKARFPVSYADAFAVVTARRAGAVVVTGDPEFRAVEHLVEVEWLPARAERPSRRPP
jgi:ribonuclease VapC